MVQVPSFREVIPSVDVEVRVGPECLDPRGFQPIVGVCHQDGAQRYDVYAFRIDVLCEHDDSFRGCLRHTVVGDDDQVNAVKLGAGLQALY